MFKIALEGPNDNFDNIIEEAITLWSNGTKYRFLYANPSRYMSSARDVFCSITSIMFPDYEDVNQLKGCKQCRTNQPLKQMYAPSLNPHIFKVYILDPKIVGLSKVQLLPRIHRISFTTDFPPSKHNTSFSL